MDSWPIIVIFSLLISFETFFITDALNGTGKYEKGSHARLLKDLFKGYDKRIRPLADEGVPVLVHGTLLGAILIQV
uniref:Neurotransmitter-gated ion-channel ligand-binding domain-containing protein n=1 Tax=Acrobeloides nanus TaxID=290746 RepID=A0A914D061_9BILA